MNCPDVLRSVMISGFDQGSDGAADSKSAAQDPLRMTASVRTITQVRSRSR
jgi:hypothetical protein